MLLMLKRTNNLTWKGWFLRSPEIYSVLRCSKLCANQKEVKQTDQVNAGSASAAREPGHPASSHTDHFQIRVNLLFRRLLVYLRQWKYKMCQARAVRSQQRHRANNSRRTTRTTARRTRVAWRSRRQVDGARRTLCPKCSKWRRSMHTVL